MFCRRCGRAVPEGAVLCDECRARLHRIRVRRKAKKQNNNLTVIIIAVTVVLCTAIIASVAGRICVKSGREQKEVMTEDNVSVMTDDFVSEPGTEPDTTVQSEENTKTTEQTDEAGDVDVLQSMSNARRREVNVFLSNFSEAFLEFFDPVEYVSDGDLISFAFTHNSINSSKKTVYDGDYMGISAENADITLKRFFGRTVSHESAVSSNGQKWTYKDGMFITPAADGESHAYFSIATDMRDNGNGTYTVQFNSYFDDEHTHDGPQKEWYTYSVSQADSRCTLKYKGEAIVKPKKHNGSDTYELVSYFTYND